MNFSEKPIVFPCQEDSLIGIIAEPEHGAATGLLLVVGGPQYRVGSHRQFRLLSRTLADAGYPVMRFDFRGMGDSSGRLRDFEQVDEDIGAAIEAFCANCPSVERIVLWGLCDAASASLLYLDAINDARISGLVLLNPWVRSEATQARARVKHYYRQRLFQRDFWRKFLTGKMNVFQAIGGLVGNWNTSLRLGKKSIRQPVLCFQARMLSGLKKMQIPLLLILSGKDYVAKEFLDVVQLEQDWQMVLQRQNVKTVAIPEADHTFSSAEWRAGVEQATQKWLNAVFKD
ncbi:MAG: hydrolase 1, exosortase A system-associated [Gammaproteobacteria bacterium]|nr:hydrolase 1, exosortase A system-associated [Gammaproteobacteria bacterium]MBU2435851.1 hydrolase 1, exosortase A system-associated [Gammaproteobacteria bacterium]MBU2449368.1 hydrolase 1, exosortase A system-associated [Gammaproteobacteria bacterium]